MHALYAEVLTQQLRQDVLLILASAGIAAWGYWLPLPGVGRMQSAVVRAFGRILLALMVVAVVVLGLDGYQTYRDLQLGAPDRLVGEVATKDTTPRPFRQKGAITLQDSPIRFVVELERLRQLDVGDRVEVEYARYTRTVLRLEVLRP